MAGVSDTLSAQYMQYISNTGDSQSWQASGAYIFRPLHNEADVILLILRLLTNLFTYLRKVEGVHTCLIRLFGSLLTTALIPGTWSPCVV